MARYRPGKPFDVPMLLYPVCDTISKLGVPTKVYDDAILFFGSFATYGGTERETNGVMTVEDTATVEIWYRPEFSAASRVALANDQTRVYEIIGEPENIEQKNQFCKMKLTRVKGGA